METKELRIGNFIEDIHYPELILFTGVDLELFAGLYDGTILESDLQPIPLTEKWLLDFGFEEKDSKFYKEGFFCYLIYGGESGWKTWVNLCKDDFTLSLIGQVHQLQNLYFALTGKELQLKQQST